MDKRVPIAIIGALVIQAAGAFYWGGNLASQVQAVEQRVERLEMSQTQADAQQTAILERLARMEERSAQQLRVLERIEQRLGGGGRPDIP